MTNSPKPSGGMPTWLIVLIVIFLFIVLGCCGGFYACTHFFHQVATFSEEKLKEESQKQIEQAQKKIHDADTQQAQDLKSQGSQPAPGDLPTRTDIPQENTTPAPGNKPNGDVGATVVEPAVKAVKMPTTFPDDVPLYKGLTPTFAIDDKIHSTGSVILSGTDKVDAMSDFYVKQMADKGWTIDTNMTISGNSYQTYSKDTRKVSITITSDGAKTQVAIIYGAK